MQLQSDDESEYEDFLPSLNETIRKNLEKRRRERANCCSSVSVPRADEGDGNAVIVERDEDLLV